MSIVDDRLVAVSVLDGHGVYATPGHPVDEHVVQTPLDIKAAADPGSWTLSSAEDPAYRRPSHPDRVGRKSKGRDYAIPLKPTWHVEWTLEHTLLLALPHRLHPGKRYALTLRGLVEGDGTTAFAYDPGSVRSEAVHVNEVGFRPDAARKFGYVSYWAGDLGGLPLADRPPVRFRVMELTSGATVFSGTVSLRKRASGEPDGLQPGEGNHLRADLWEADFSQVRKPGAYRLCVDEFGCSFPFRIAPDVYREAFATTMRGLYQQRCGTALDPAVTDWSRSVCHHPSLAPVHQSRLRYMEGHCDACTTVEDSGESRDAWGGYHDAGDWDREGGHPEIPMVLSFTYELLPDRFQDGDLLIPERHNGIPDILDEARWSLDYWRRLQRPDGGVSLGLFLDHFPRPGEAADMDRGHWYVYAEDPQMSYRYAAAACHFAFALAAAGRAGDGSRWIDLAGRAWGWAETHQRFGDGPKVRDDRSHAAACLYRATGERRYHDVVRAALAVLDPAKPLWIYDQVDLRWTSWVYALTNRPDVDGALKRRAQEAAIAWARRVFIDTAEHKGLRYGFDPWIPLAWGAATVPPTLPLVVAARLSGDPAFVTQQELDCDFTLGGNPLNMTWVTHLGSRWPDGVFHPDSWVHTPDGTVAPGIVPEGPHRYEHPGGAHSGPWDDQFVENSAYPPAKEWPTLELYFAARTCYPMNEFTVAQIAYAASAYGALCAPVR